jgi:hypothetical protein
MCKYLEEDEGNYCYNSPSLEERKFLNLTSRLPVVRSRSRHQWLILAILAILEAEIGRILVQGQPRQIV